MTRRHCAFATVVVTLGLVMGGTSPAMAADAGSLVSVVNGNDPSSTQGANGDTVQVSAPAACDPAATRHVMKVVKVTAAKALDQPAADRWVGDNLYAPVGVGLPGPLTVKSSNSWQGLADTFGQDLVPGVYRIELRCLTQEGSLFEQWSGQVTFSTGKAWTGSAGVKATTGAGGTAKATPDSPRETPGESSDGATVTGSPSAAPSADPSDSESTAVLGSGSAGGDSDGGSGGLAATGAKVAGISALGALFLVTGFGLIALSRRRRDRPTIRAGR